MKEILIFVALLLVHNIYGQSAGRLAAIQLIQEGDAQAQLGNWRPAIDSYTNAIMTDIDYAEAYMKRGQLYERTLQFQLAQKDYDQALKLNPFVNVYYDERARFKMLALDYHGALKDLSKGISVNNRNPLLTEHQVDQYLLLEDYSAAQTALNAIHKEDLNKNFYFQRQGFISIKTEKLTEAKRFLDSAYAIERNAPLTLDLLGIYHLKNKNYDSSIYYLNLSIEIEPQQYLAHYNRAISHRFLGNEKEALADLNKAIELNQNEADLYYKRALIKKETGELSAAKSDYKKAVEIDSTHEKAAYNLVFTNILLGNYVNAMETLEEAETSTWDNTDYWNLKGNVAILNRRYEEAIVFFNRSESNNNTNPKTFYNRGIAYLLDDKPIQACNDFKTSLSYGYEPAGEIIEFFCGH